MSVGRAAIGWGLLAVSFVGGVTEWWLGRSPSTTLRISPEIRTELADLPDTAYSDWLTQFYGRLSRENSSLQTLILQGAPGEVPMVIATVRDANGDEDATHWPIPWPAVADVLRKGKIGGPLTVASTQHGMNYVHHLVPFDSTGSRCLLVNEFHAGRSWISPLNLVFACLGVCGIVLLATE